MSMLCVLRRVEAVLDATADETLPASDAHKERDWGGVLREMDDIPDKYLLADGVFYFQDDTELRMELTAPFVRVRICASAKGYDWMFDYRTPDGLEHSATREYASLNTCLRVSMNAVNRAVRVWYSRTDFMDPVLDALRRMMTSRDDWDRDGNVITVHDCEFRVTFNPDKAIPMYRVRMLGDAPRMINACHPTHAVMWMRHMAHDDSE